MAAHPLRCPSPIDPFWLQRLRGGPVTGTVTDGGAVDLHGRLLEGAPYPAGTDVQVFLGGDGRVVCESLAEQALRCQEHHERQRQDAQRESQARAVARQRAEEVNASIHLPGRWAVGIKDVLSGLSAGSNGSGRNRSTVQHVLLLEDLDLGRLRRQAGQFLCDSLSAPQAKQWAAKRVEPCQDEHGPPCMPEVTCQRCLALAPRPLPKARPRP